MSRKRHSSDVAPWVVAERDAQREQRAVRRQSAARYSANLLNWQELIGWLSQHCPGDCRSGRVSGDFIVTKEAFDNVPGDEIKAFENGAGETVWTKKLEVLGAPTFSLRITCIDDAA